MKKLFLFIFLLMNVSLAKSQQIIALATGDTVHGVFSQTPTRSIEYVENGILVTYTFEKATMLEDPLYDGGYMWRYRGFGLNDNPAQPAIPYRLDAFTIPKGCSARIELVDSQFVDLPYTLSPARPPLVESDNEGYSISNVPSLKAYQGFFPSSVVDINNIEVYRGDSIANVMVAPLKYSYQTNTVRAYTLITYKVTFANKNDSRDNYVIMPNVEVDDVYLSNNTLNAHLHVDRGVRTTPAPPSKSYLILSTPKFVKSVNKLVDWKKLLGYNVQTVFNNSWTPSTIKAAITDFYNNRNNLYCLLIVGDMEYVPSETKVRPFYAPSSTDTLFVTDLYYACVDGDDDTTPDLLYGRIPVKTNAEANVVIDKIIAYERNPVCDSSFYSTGLHCAYFQDKKPIYNYEDVRFTLTSEDVRNCMIDNGYNVIRVYKAEDDVLPKFWNFGTYANGEAIPEELKRPGFAWSGNATDINNAINNGSFYVLHRDHGSEYAWENPSYQISNIDTLHNANKLPVVFSINCKTGRFDQINDCFSEAFLKKEDGGCVAIYGATHTSYSGYNDILTLGMFDAVWPSDYLRPSFADAHYQTGGITPTPTYEIGQILNQGKARLSEVYNMYTYGIQHTKYTKEIFHCFGDPSMKLYTAIPTPFENVEILRSADSLYVNLNGDTATIVILDISTGETLCAQGASATFPAIQSTNIRVCISSHNRIPYICDVEPYIVYIQNENVLGPASHNAQIINVGSHVTNTKPQGPVVFNSGNIKLKAKNILIEGTTTVKKGAKLEITNK